MMWCDVWSVVVDGAGGGGSEWSVRCSPVTERDVGRSADGRRVAHHLHVDGTSLGDAHGRTRPVRLHAPVSYTHLTLPTILRV